MGSYAGPNVDYAAVAQLGMNLTSVDTAQRFPLGIRVQDDQGREWTYVLASGAIAAKANVTFSGNFTATALAGAGEIAGIAEYAIADTEFGWVITRGRVENANVATGVTSGDPLSLVADSNGDFEPVSAVNEGGASTYAAGHLTSRAEALENEASGAADVRLY